MLLALIGFIRYLITSGFGLLSSDAFGTALVTLVGIIMLLSLVGISVGGLLFGSLMQGVIIVFGTLFSWIRWLIASLIILVPSLYALVYRNNMQRGASHQVSRNRALAASIVLAIILI